MVVAYSGGVDSHVLLHRLANLRITHPQLIVTAVHINHQISPLATSWQMHCQKICTDLGIPLLIKNVDAKIKDNYQSAEEYARNLRYQAFAEVLPPNASLLTAHHADDQAETLLLQLFRGAGPKGLAAMPAKIPFAAGLLLRPLLTFSRTDLLNYAEQHHLSWIEDDSNLSTKFDRNYLRHEIMPKIKQRWPGVLQTLSRVAKHSAETDQLLQHLAAQDYRNISGSVKNTLSISKILELPEARRNNVLRYWLHDLQFATPLAHHLQQIYHTILQCRQEAKPIVRWDGVEIRRYQDNLYAMSPLTPHDPTIILNWDLTQPLLLPGNLGTLSTTPSGNQSKINLQPITVHFRCGGEKIKIPGRSGTHALKKLWQEWGVPPWQRDRIPLIYFGEVLIGVVGFVENQLEVSLLLK